MTDHHTPELEAVELEAIGWFVRTKRTDEDSAGWLIADCSTAQHGKDWARLFARSHDLLGIAKDLLHLATHNNVPEEQQIEIAERAIEIIAAAEGRTEQ